MSQAAGDIRILLLAAGNGSRFGGAKQGALINGTSMVRRAALSALATGARLMVVTGAHADLVTQELAGLPATLLHNPDWVQGMGGSIATGFRYWARSSTPPAAAIVCLADQPLVGESELRSLIAIHGRVPERIVVADYRTTVGPPCLFPRRFFAELIGLHGASGARRVLERHASELEPVSMPQAAVDIDTPEDYRRLDSPAVALQ